MLNKDKTIDVAKALLGVNYYLHSFDPENGLDCGYKFKKKQFKRS